MNRDFIIVQGLPYPLGTNVQENGINFAIELHSKVECGIILYDKKSLKQIKIPFSKETKIGSMYCVYMKSIDYKNVFYNFYEDDKVIIDPYSKRIVGKSNWGKECNQSLQMSEFLKTPPRMLEEKPLKIPYEDSILYCLHVRGFTKHPSSKVKNKGTFAGIVEKIPYLKEIGITGIELLPIYEFDEIEHQMEPNSMSYMDQRYKDKLDSFEKKPTKINYWGFKNAFYFAPKSSYCATDDPITEMKEMIGQLHENGIEVIMQFYFPDEVKQSYLLEVLKYWVLVYGIDGIHLKGNNIPILLIASDPFFSSTKLLYCDFPIHLIYEQSKTPEYRNLSVFNDDFMCHARKFLKGDEGMLNKMLAHFKKNPSKNGIINYITNYDGFTLKDLVSYERKRNEANGEDNKDGNDYNYSWNCGHEGITKKRVINNIRNKQMKNAMILMILSQGTPFILSGDEFGNSQNGNNNPYCQDNEISWLNWNLIISNEEMYSFYKQLVNLRKEHKIFRRSTEYTLLDSLGCSYPDLSYHSEEAWKITTENYNRNVGIMYCGRYVGEDVNIFIAYNMYWKEEQFALPKLEKGREWYLMMDTSEKESFLCEHMYIKDSKTITRERSIQILISK
ncbi:MAG TPA: alpha-amylase family glycosyl hydrolase [Lachnospiraceae bacterium]|nr:alpha-amylase family glycosyl hydrolase [Lachnospiraceae bacterium]